MEIYEDREGGSNYEYGDPVPDEVTLAHMCSFWKLVANDVRAHEEYKKRFSQDTLLINFDLGEVDN